jgi:hypothetical protein
MQVSAPLSKAIDELQAHARLETASDIEAFERAMVACAEFAPEMSGQDVEGVLRAFRDDTTHKDVMWGLVHLVEATPIEAFVAAFLKVLPELEHAAGDWMLRLLIATTNHETASLELVHQARVVPDAFKGPLLRLLQHATDKGIKSPAGALRAIIERGGSKS